MKSHTIHWVFWFPCQALENCYCPKDLGYSREVLIKTKEASKGREAAWAHGTSLKWRVHDLPWMLLELYLLCSANNILGVDYGMVEVSKNWTQKCSCCPTSAKQRWRITSVDLLVWECFAGSWSPCCPSGPQAAFQPVIPQHVLVSRVNPPEVQSLVIPHVELVQIPLRPFLQPAKASLKVTQPSGVLPRPLIYKLAEGKFHLPAFSQQG